MTPSVFIGIHPERYEELEQLLDKADYLPSANVSSQEQFIAGIPHFKPVALIVDDSLSGTQSKVEFYRLLRERYPDLKVIVYSSDMIDFVIPYLSGERPVPPYYEDEKEPSPFIEIDPDDPESIDEEEGSIRLGKWLNLNRRDKRNKRDNRQNYDEEKEVEILEDWDRTTTDHGDIHTYIKKTIAVTSASGGVGKTDLSINLAVHAAKNGFKTVLCGFNLENDDVAGRLGLKYLRGKKLASAFELFTQNRLNAGSLEDMLQDYKGLKVLVGIENPIERQDMTEEFFKTVLRILRANYDLVILDTENNSYSPAYLPVVEAADHVLVPCTTHNSVLEHVRDELYSWKDDFDISLSKVDIIFNKANEGGFITKDHIEKNTAREVIATIPYSKDVLRGSERESPAVLANSSDGKKIRKEMDKIVFRITGRHKRDVEFIKRGFLLFGKKVKLFAQSD